MKKLIFLSIFTPALALANPTLHLDADARTSVANDEMVVTLSVEREGHDSAPLTDSVLRSLTNAADAAKRLPGVEPRLGSVSTHPTWRDNKKIGWTVRGEINLTSADMKGLSKLTGQLTESLQLSRVHFRLSEAKRRTEEAKLLEVAAANFREKAKAATASFGFRNYELKDLVVGQSGIVAGPRPMMGMEMMSMKSDRASVPVESGDTEVTVTVSGKVDLLK